MSSIAATDEALAPLDADLRLAIAHGLAQARTLWEGRVGHDGPGRHAVRLLAQDGYEAWLIGWPAGHCTMSHDHGGSTAAIVVIEGELVELRAGPDGAHRRHLTPGEGIALAAEVIHDVGNETTGPATSVHVYSPPLSRMTFYDDRGIPDAVWESDGESPSSTPAR